MFWECVSLILLLLLDGRSLCSCKLDARQFGQRGGLFSQQRCTAW